MKKLISKKIIGVGVLLIIALVSIFVISPSASSTEFHAKSIQSLDDKKVKVTEITAATAGVSAVLALVPGDATTPIANQIIKLSSYLLIVVGAIFLEKILLTLTGYVSFTFLIPIACLLYGFYLFVQNDILKKLAIKLAIFGIIIFMVVPVSVKVSDLIENTYNQTIEEATNSENLIEETTSEEDEEESEGFSGWVSKIKDSVSDLGENVSELKQKGEKILSNFIDAIAILLITSCVIPIAVLLFFIWIVKIIFGVNIPTSNIKKKKLKDDIDEPIEISKAETEK
jgi:hypothetical protein